MAPRRRKSIVNAAELLDLRSRGIPDAGSLYRRCLRLFRDILLQDNRAFVKVWSKTSKSAIMYENGNIYFDNYVNCYSCVHAEPHCLYRLSKRSKQEKIKDALLCQSPLEKTLPSTSDHSPSLLTLTSNNWLRRFSAETGKELQSVYLSAHYNFKYRYLGWNASQETFYIKTSQTKETLLGRQAGISYSTFTYLAVFNVFPLQIVGVFEINKKGFGRGITDVVMSQGVLAVSYSNQKVRLYSFEHIVQRYLTEKLTLGKPCSLLEGKNVGEFPFGIPINIQITGSLPVLFETSSINGVQIGGYPWHFIYTPPQRNQRGTHHICALKDGTLAKNGIQNMSGSFLESDAIFFHPADSRRIIHIGPTRMNVLKIVGEVNSPLPSKILQDFSLMIDRNKTNPSSEVTVTSSGRTVKKRFQKLDDDAGQETFRLVECEDELDLLAAVVTNGEEEEACGYIQLHDDETGTLQRKIDLAEIWDETFPHVLCFDKDTIVHIEQKKTSFSCHVYKLRTVRK